MSLRGRRRSLVALLAAGLVLQIPASATAQSSPAAGAQEIVPPIVPLRFQGVWEGNLKACPHKESDTRLTIKDRTIYFFEADGEIRKVALRNRDTIAITSAISREGQVSQDVSRFRLESADTLVKILDDGTVYERRRCPTMDGGQ